MIKARKKRLSIVTSEVFASAKKMQRESRNHIGLSRNWARTSFYQLWRISISNFHIWTLNLASHHSCIFSISLRRGPNWAYCGSKGSGFQHTKFQTFHIWAWNLTRSGESSSCTRTLSLLGINIWLICALQTGFSKREQCWVLIMLISLIRADDHQI